MRTVSLLLPAALVLVSAAAFAAGNLLPVTVCVTCRVDRTPHSLHAEFAARHYAHEYPQLNVTTRFVGRYEAGGTTQRGLIRAFVEHADSCDVVVGPGSSSIAVALNPLVDGAWIDYSATSTELSSRFDFPLFNRVVPTDEDATRGYAPLLRAANWQTLDLLCVDTSYGRSVAAGLGAVASGLGGQLHATPCVGVDADEATMTQELQKVFSRGMRVVFVAMSSSDPAFASLIAAAQALSAPDRLVFLFSEAACSAAAQPWAALPGAFCATFALQDDVVAPFRAAYQARDTTGAAAAYSVMNWPTAQVDLQGSGVFPVFAADATRFALRALHAAASRSNPPALPTKGEARAAALRDFNMSGGATGAIAIPSGDRQAAAMVILNSLPDGTVNIGANISSFGAMSSAASLYALNAFRSLDEMPPSVDPAPPSATQLPVAVIVAIVLLGSVAAVGLGVALRMALRPSARDNACAPKDASEPFAMLFTDIQGSTSQWAAHPEAFGPAVDTHHAVLRAAVARHGGYEVKTIGDAFMVAFADAGAAVACAVDAQEALFAAAWPSCIDALYRAQAAEAGLPSARLSEGAYAEQWAGVRVRIGVHYGLGEIKLDPVSQGYDYYGTVVNTAARVEGVAHGGQVLVSAAALAAAGGVGGVRGAVVSALGPQPLRGLAEPVELFQVLPARLAEREFPPLRLQYENIVDNEVTDTCDPSFYGDARSTAGRSLVSRQTETTSASSHGDREPDYVELTVGLPARIPRDAPEFVCQQAARRVEGATFEGMVFQYHVLKAVVSTLPANERAKTVCRLSDRWRISEGKALRRVASGGNESDIARSTDRVIALLATRAAPVAARYTNPYGGTTAGPLAASRYDPRPRVRSVASLGEQLAKSVGILSRSGHSDAPTPDCPQSPTLVEPDAANRSWSPSGAVGTDPSLVPGYCSAVHHGDPLAPPSASTLKP